MFLNKSGNNYTKHYIMLLENLIHKLHPLALMYPSFNAWHQEIQLFSCLCMFSKELHLITTYQKPQIINYQQELPASQHPAPQHLNHLISISHHKKEHSLTASDSSLLVSGALQEEKKCISPSHLWVSHDQSTLQIDMLLSNTGLLAVKRREGQSECRWRRVETKMVGAARAEGKDETHRGEPEQCRYNILKLQLGLCIVWNPFIPVSIKCFLMPNDSFFYYNSI